TSSVSPRVFLFEDIHANIEAQKNLAASIHVLVQHKATDLIALEGASGWIDLEAIRGSGFDRATRIVADYLLKEHRISGAVYALLTSRALIPPVLGAEDRSLYRANVRACRRALSLSSAETQWLHIKQRTLSPSLSESGRRLSLLQKLTHFALAPSE